MYRFPSVFLQNKQTFYRTYNSKFIEWNRAKLVFISLLFIYPIFVLSVTRSLSRALKIIGTDILAKNEQPMKIKNRRATQPVPSASSKQHQIRYHSLTNPKDTTIRKWCVCRRGSFGNMIFCENQGCRIKWFHMTCVNLTVVPKGDWFCAYCAK